MNFYLLLKTLVKICKLVNKYCQKLVDSAKKYATDALRTASKRAIQKTAEATWDLVGNKIAELQVTQKNLQIVQHICIQMNLIMTYQ